MDTNTDPWTTPAVRVVAMRLGLPPGAEPVEWYAVCLPCNWYGDYWPTRREAAAAASRHRRSHR